METIRELFENSKLIDCHIETVTTYEPTNDDLLKQEILKYVLTESIEQQIEHLLDLVDESIEGGNSEVGVWVSGFFGSGKSTFTKYLGFALDPGKKLYGKPFLTWLQDRFNSPTLKQKITKIAEKFPATVFMINLAAEQTNASTQVEISKVLYAKVMQWAGYSKDLKTAYLEFILDRDNKIDHFKKRINEINPSETWDSIKNHPLAIKSIIAKIASEYYPEIWANSQSFNDIKIEDVIAGDDQIHGILDLIRHKSGKENIIIIFDEVGQYVGAKDDLILDLENLASNIKKTSNGRALLIATAQHALTEEANSATTNTNIFFKLKDRFPIEIDLNLIDIKEIIRSRVLSKSKEGQVKLASIFDNYETQIRHSTELTKTSNIYLDKNIFVDLYPFLPQHFDILLQLLSHFSKTPSVMPRSAIMTFQNALVGQTNVGKGFTSLFDEPIGTLLTTIALYDTLASDIERSFPHIVRGVGKVEVIFGQESIQLKVAKSIAVLQILKNFPVNRGNIAALIYPNVSSGLLLDNVNVAVNDMLSRKSVPLIELDDSLCFISEMVEDLDKEFHKIIPLEVDNFRILGAMLNNLFYPLPSVSLYGVKNVGTGLKIQIGNQLISINGDDEEIQTIIEFIPEIEFETIQKIRIFDSQHSYNCNVIFFLGCESQDLDELIIKKFQCAEIYNQYHDKPLDLEAEKYLQAQKQRADDLSLEISSRMQKSLLNGVVIFRGEIKAAKEIGNNLSETFVRFLRITAEIVFEKFKEAAVHVDSLVAEKFLELETFDFIREKDDPLGLVQVDNTNFAINSKHGAIISIICYLETHAQVDGHRLLNDFSRAPFGWSKDSIRYIIAAMFLAAVVKFRVNGEDIIGRCKLAIDSLRSTDSFNKIGISLRGMHHIALLIKGGESKTCEFKETLSLDIKTQKKEDYIEKSVFKTIVAFLNTYGGTLLVGVKDNHDISGIETEIEKLHKNSRDKFLLHFKNLFKSKIGPAFYPLVDYDILEIENKLILEIKCKPSNEACFLSGKEFFVRTNPASDELVGPELVDYVSKHFKKV